MKTTKGTAKRAAKEQRAEASTKVAPASPRRRRSARGTIAIVAIALMAVAAWRPACTLRLEDPVAKLAAAIGERSAASEIAIVAIDDRSIKEVGSWPWPRAAFVNLLEGCAG